jgi:hypothetical protein
MHTDAKIEQLFGELPIKHLVFVCDEFIVFVDDENDVDWYTSTNYDANRPEDTKAQNDILSLAAAIETTPCQHMSESVRVNFKRLIGEGIARALQEDYSNARAILKRAETFVMLRSQEQSRYWYVTASGTAGAVMTLLFIVLWIFRVPVIENLGATAFRAVLAAAAGAMGATLSIIMRMGKLQLDCLSGKPLHYVEGVSRVAAGALSGLLVFLAVESGQLLPMLLKSAGGHIAILFAAIAAGASERWAPSIVSKFEGTGNRLNDKAPNTRTP